MKLCDNTTITFLLLYMASRIFSDIAMPENIHNYMVSSLALVLLNSNPNIVNSVYPDQLASEEAYLSGSALFFIANGVDPD